MKKLILLRHAKASKDAAYTDDFERPLTDRGIADIKKTSAALTALAIPDLIMCSPAKRTKETAEHFCKSAHLPAKLIIFDLDMYLASVNDLIHIIRQTDDNINVLMLVGHNPAITGLVGTISNTFIEHIPTSGAVLMDLTVTSWKLVSANTAIVQQFISPKH